MVIPTAFADIVSVETDQSEYFIGDEIMITVVVDDKLTKDSVDMQFKIMNLKESNIVAIGQAKYIEENLYEAIISELKDDMVLESGEHILLTTRGGVEPEIKQRIMLINEPSANPNRPNFSNEIEVDPIFQTACLAEGDILNDEGICVKEIPSVDIKLNDSEEIQLVPLSQYEQLQQENLELKMENRELENRVQELTDEIIKMTDDFIITIQNQMNWFMNQNSN